jgi:integrase
MTEGMPAASESKYRLSNGRRPLLRARPVCRSKSVPRRELRELKLRSGRDGDDLVFGRTAREPALPSERCVRRLKAWKGAGIEPITLHEARHGAISFFIPSGLDLKQVSTWAGHSDIRVALNRYDLVIPAPSARPLTA